MDTAKELVYNQPMAAPRKDNVKNLILDSAERLLQTQSLADVSLAEIAKASGVSKGTLYYHYNSKNDILFDITDRYLEKQWNDLIAWTEDEQKDTSLHRLVMYVLKRDIQTANMRIYLIYEAINGNGELREKLTNRYNDFAKIIAEKISKRGAAVSPNFLSWLILLASDGLFIQNSLQNGGIDTDEFIEQMILLAKMLSDNK